MYPGVHDVAFTMGASGADALGAGSVEGESDAGVGFEHAIPSMTSMRRSVTVI